MISIMLSQNTPPSLISFKTKVCWNIYFKSKYSLLKKFLEREYVSFMLYQILFL